MDEGALLNSRYKLGRELGCGGSGRVFEAFDLSGLDLPNERVALKRMHETMDPLVFERLRREIDILKTIDSRHVVYALDSDPQWRWYTMPLADEDLWSRAPLLDSCERIQVIMDVASALEDAHLSKIIHRDISPGNVLWFAQERVWRLSDFGLARRFPGHTTRLITAEGGGAVLGAIHFAAPELELSPGSVDHRCDIFSFGQMIGWLVTGRKPVPQQQTLLSESPWRDLVAEMTSRALDARPGSMGEVRARIADISERCRNENRIAWEQYAIASVAQNGIRGATVATIKLLFRYDGAADYILLQKADEAGLTEIGVLFGLGEALDRHLVDREEESGREGVYSYLLTREGRDMARSVLEDSDLFLVRQNGPLGEPEDFPF